MPILITMLVSAIWHGFYSGYFVFFIAIFFLDVQSKLAGKLFTPRLTWCPEIIQTLGAWVYLYAYCAYFSISFLLLNSDIYNVTYASMGYIPHYSLMITLSTVAVLNLVASKPKVNKVE